MKTFYEIHMEKTGKESDKWGSYFDAYEDHFSAFRDKKIKLLEIGVQNGGSLETWAEYFPNASDIVGVDVDPTCGSLEFDDPRINVIVGDACDKNVANRIINTYDNFDIIIDDGSHTSRDIIAAFQIYFRNLNIGGVYLAEDLHASYYASYGGGLWHPASSMRFFNLLTDCVNFEHWGISLSRSDFLKRFSKLYNIDFDEDIFSCVRSVEFRNSICTLYKCEPGKNNLGARILCGEEEAVAKGRKILEDSRDAIVDESKNEWSREDPYDSFNKLKLAYDQLEISLHKKEYDDSILNSKVSELENDIIYLNSRIENLLSSTSWKITAPFRRIISLFR